MEIKWLKQTEAYDGTQLRSLYAYLGHKILGDSCVAWRGGCNISFKHMVDGEDLLEKAEIRGSDMVHFIVEIFDAQLLSGVLLQRLMATIVRDVIFESSKLPDLKIVRTGDDLYWGKKKLTISIATKSPVSTLVHFAINVSNKGTPVETACLDDLKLKPMDFGKKVLEKLKSEYEDSVLATQKVRPVS